MSGVFRAAGGAGVNGVSDVGRATSTLAETWLLAGRGMRRFLRSPQLLVDTIAMPLLLMFMMLAVFGQIVGGATHTPYVARLAPAVVLFSAAASAVVTGVGFYVDFHSGLTDRFRTMPISRLAPLLGRIASDLMRMLVGAILATAVAYVPGFRFTQGPLAAAGFFGIVLLFGWVFLWLALLLACTAKSEDALNGALRGPVTLMLFLSAGFVPVAAFPGVVQPIVRANPLSCAANAAIGLASGGPVLVPTLQTLAWTCAVTAVAAPVAVRLYHRRGTPGNLSSPPNRRTDQEAE